MTSVSKKKRTWAGYACPVCRFIFRVPKDHDGVGVICPACRYLLKIPQTNQAGQGSARNFNSHKKLAIAPRGKKQNKSIVARPLAETDKLADVDYDYKASSLKGHRVRRPQKPSAAAPSWDRQGASKHAKEGNALAWIVAGSFIGLMVVAVGAWVVMDNVSPQQQDEDDRAEVLEWNKNSLSHQSSTVAMTPEELKVQNEIEQSVATGKIALEESQKVVEAFLTAETTEDLYGIVRSPEVTVPRMQEWYTSHEWVAPGVKEIACGGGITIKGVMATMAVRLNDYSVQPISLERTPKGFLVDWESWVGWSEVRWSELFKQRPTESVEIRAICSKDSYYNRLFKDDSKWLAVRMVYPGEDRSIYGYIDLQKPSLAGLLGDLRQGAIAVTIKIRYPKDSVADNQVYIDEYLQSGWVRASEDDSDTPKADE